MPSFEVVLRLADGTGRETSLAFALEPGQQVLFGRSPDADIVIPDHNRKVSSRHGRIACQPDGSLRGYDLASLNGTYLHGEALDTEIGGALTDGDRLRVGDFELVLTMTAGAAGPPGLAEPAPALVPGTDRMSAPAEAAAAPAPPARPVRRSRRAASTTVAAGPLLESIERAYADSLQQDATARGDRIAAALAAGLATLPADRRELATAALLDDFLIGDFLIGDSPIGGAADDVATGSTDAPEQAARSPVEGPAPPTVAPSSAASCATASPVAAAGAPSQAAAPSPAATPTVLPTAAGSIDHLQLLALRLVPGLQLANVEQRARFMTLLAQVCESTLDWLARGLEGRAVFGQEFGAEVTLVFQRSTNPLKGMSRDELKRYLLDWTDTAPPDTRRQYLEGVLEDLHDHQVGVLAGVEEAVTGVLTRLSPERVEGIASQQKAKGWTAATRSWQTYCQLHQELAEERTKLFHELISPAIQKGYLHRHGDRNGDAETP